MPEADQQRPALRLVAEDEHVAAPSTDDPVLDVDADLPDEAVDALIAAYLVEHGLPKDTDPNRF